MSIGVPRRVRSVLIVAGLCVAAYFLLLPRFGYESRFRIPTFSQDVDVGYESPPIIPQEGQEVEVPVDLPLEDSGGVSKPGGRPTYMEADVEKRDAVVAAFKYAWKAYERDAMGYDEYHSLSHNGENLGQDSGGIGYTVIDALDTMLLMNLTTEYTRSHSWIAHKLSFDRNGEFNVFETTIRVLGGLLSAFHLTGDELFLDKAKDLGERMIPAFDTQSGLPYPSVNLHQRKGVPDRWQMSTVSTAEAASLQLEFKYLAQVSGREEFWHKAEKVLKIIDGELPAYGKFVVPIYMSMNGKGSFTKSDVRLGSRGDSYYEYLLKQYLQTNRSEVVYKQMYIEAMQSVHDHMVKKTPRRKMTYIAELVNSASGFDTSDKQDHLVCFFAGTLMLGATTIGLRPGVSRASVPPDLDRELTMLGKRDWITGRELLETCVRTHETETGLSPEIVQFGEDPNGERDVVQREWYIKGSKKGGPATYDARYMLRPETVESLFIAYRLTGDTKYRTQAWDIFSAIEKHCRIPESEGGGYASVLDVDTVPVRWDDKQETFFLSETLKYLYLTFAEQDLMNLDHVVFNTEAHPLPVFSPTIQPQFIG